MKKKLVVLCMAVSLMLTACGSKVEVQEPTMEAESEPVVETDAEETVSQAEEVTMEVETETQAPEEESASDFVKGKVTNTGWESEWLGMRYVMADGMVMSTEEELNAMMGISQEMLSEEFSELQLKYAELNTVYEMMCTAADQASNVNVTLEKLPIKIDIDTYVDLIKT